MKLLVLGSGTAIPQLDRGASGYVCLADSGAALALECGPGSLRSWPRFGLKLEDVQGVVVSHYHVDHCGDLSALLFARNVAGTQSPLHVIGPKGHRAHLEALRAAFGEPVADTSATRTVVELSEGDGCEVGPFEVQARVVRHSPGALGLRVLADGKVLAFSGDSGPCSAVEELCRGADLALLECSHPAGTETENHLTAATAAEIAHRAGVHRLVLTHFYDTCQGHDLGAQVRAAGYQGKLHLARDGASYPV